MLLHPSPLELMNNNEEPRSLIVYVFCYKLGPVYNQSSSVNKATLFIIKFDGSNWMEEPETKGGRRLTTLPCLGFELGLCQVAVYMYGIDILIIIKL